MDYSKIESIKLYLIRTPANADEVDAELDRRNHIAATPRKRKVPKWRMIDYEYENNRWHFGEE